LELLANIGIEYVPSNKNYTTKKEQNKISLDKDKQNNLIKEFNEEKVDNYFDSLDNFYVFGIDR